TFFFSEFFLGFSKIILEIQENFPEFMEIFPFFFSDRIDHHSRRLHRPMPPTTGQEMRQQKRCPQPKTMQMSSQRQTMQEMPQSSLLFPHLANQRLLLRQGTLPAEEHRRRPVSRRRTREDLLYRRPVPERRQ